MARKQKATIKGKGVRDRGNMGRILKLFEYKISLAATQEMQACLQGRDHSDVSEM